MSKNWYQLIMLLATLETFTADSAVATIYSPSTFDDCELDLPEEDGPFMGVTDQRSTVAVSD